MKPALALAALFLAAPLFATSPEDRPSPSKTATANEARAWPRKGDTIAVPVELKYRGEDGAQRSIEICLPLMVYSHACWDCPIRIDKPFTGLCLSGDGWDDHLRPTRNECLRVPKPPFPLLTQDTHGCLQLRSAH